MSIMAPEVPVPDGEGEAIELEVHYEFDDDVLSIRTTYGGARVFVEVDWNETDTPGQDLDTLLQILPGVIARVHQTLQAEQETP